MEKKEQGWAYESADKGGHNEALEKIILDAKKEELYNLQTELQEIEQQIREETAQLRNAIDQAIMYRPISTGLVLKNVEKKKTPVYKTSVDYPRYETLKREIEKLKKEIGIQ